MSITGINSSTKSCRFLSINKVIVAPSTVLMLLGTMARPIRANDLPSLAMQLGSWS